MDYYRQLFGIIRMFYQYYAKIAGVSQQLSFLREVHFDRYNYIKSFENPFDICSPLK